MTPARQAELIAKHSAFYLVLYTGEPVTLNDDFKQYTGKPLPNAPDLEGYQSFSTIFGLKII